MSRANTSSRHVKEEEKTLRDAENIVYKSSLVLLEGTLTLTTQRLIFKVGEKESVPFPLEDQPSDDPFLEAKPEESLDSREELSLPISSIVSSQGHRGLFRTSLSVICHDDENNVDTKVEFIQKSSALGQENVEAWAQLIEEMRTKEMSELQSENSKEYAFTKNGLEARILAIMQEGEWEGVFQIKEALQETELLGLEFDQVEAACKKLVQQKLVEQDRYGNIFRKLPLSSAPSK